MGCIEIKCAMKFIGVITMLNAFGVIMSACLLMFTDTMNELEDDSVDNFLCLLTATSLPLVYAGYMFYLWFKKDQRKTRDALIKALKVSMWVYIAKYTFYIIGAQMIFNESYLSYMFKKYFKPMLLHNLAMIDQDTMEPQENGYDFSGLGDILNYFDIALGLFAIAFSVLFFKYL